MIPPTRRLLTCVAISMMLISIVLATSGCGAAAEGESATDTRLPIRVTQGGFTVSLETMSTTNRATLVTFRIEKTQDAEGPAIEAYVGMQRSDLEFEGLSWNGGHNGELKPVFSGNSIVGFEETLELAPLNSSEGVMRITYSHLRFQSSIPGDPQTLVPGPWTFSFSPSAASNVDAKVLASLGAVDAEGVVFSVDKVTLEPMQTVVDYRVEASESGALEVNHVVARFPDGSYVIPDRTEMTDNGWQAYYYSLS